MQLFGKRGDNVWICDWTLAMTLDTGVRTVIELVWLFQRPRCPTFRRLRRAGHNVDVIPRVTSHSVSLHLRVRRFGIRPVPHMSRDGEPIRIPQQNENKSRKAHSGHGRGHRWRCLLRPERTITVTSVRTRRTTVALPAKFVAHLLRGMSWQRWRATCSLWQRQTPHRSKTGQVGRPVTLCLSQGHEGYPPLWRRPPPEICVRTRARTSCPLVSSTGPILLPVSPCLPPGE